MTAPSSDILILDKRKRPEEELDSALLTDPSKADSFLNEYLDETSSTSKKPRLELNNSQESEQEELDSNQNTIQNQILNKSLVENENQDVVTLESNVQEEPKGIPVSNYQCKVINSHELMQPPTGHKDKYLGISFSFLQVQL